jgi:hypothetical protein
VTGIGYAGSLVCPGATAQPLSIAAKTKTDKILKILQNKKTMKLIN